MDLSVIEQELKDAAVDLSEKLGLRPKIGSDFHVSKLFKAVQLVIELVDVTDPLKDSTWTMLIRVGLPSDILEKLKVRCPHLPFDENGSIHADMFPPEPKFEYVEEEPEFDTTTQTGKFFMVLQPAVKKTLVRADDAASAILAVKHLEGIAEFTEVTNGTSQCEEIQFQPGTKIWVRVGKVRYGDELDYLICTDPRDDNAILEHLGSSSDLRIDEGYYTKIDEYGNE